MLQHFEHAAGLGFACPPRKDRISFLQELSTPIGQLTFAAPGLLEAKGLSPADQDPQLMLKRLPTQLLASSQQMAASFWEGSEWGRDMQAQLQAGAGEGPQDCLPRRGRYFNGPGYLTLLALKRQLAINNSMRGFYIARMVQCAIFGLIVG